ncbi:MAG TPA: hypothetical protein VK668_01865 [Mucilaginibacter sp.]|nr:hypothetical protein [Mucilaginibacter sp.]
MACIQTIPSCNFGNDVSSPLGTFGAVVAVIGTIGSVLGAVAKVTALGAAGGGAVAAVVAVIAIIVVIFLYSNSRCVQSEGRWTCVAGCISNLQPSFSEWYETIFPFAAFPNRVDVTVKSFYWGFLEQGNAYVYCNEEPYPRTSEIIHTYYYTEKLCAAESGSLLGAGIGGAAGVIAAIAVTVAIGCASVILCIFAILLAILIAAVAALIGAFAGGNIARAAADDTPPSGTSAGESTVLRVGLFVTQKGNMIKSGEDNDANVLWFARDTTIHGEAAPGTPQPFSYCEIDEQFTMDACPVVIG